MKKSLIALAVLAASGAAMAQSSVTLYGRADVNYQWNSLNQFNNGSKFSQASGGLGGSRLGFRGVEDLGNGLKAGFVLEYGLKVNDGSGFSARQSFVSLAGGFGEARFGRQNTLGDTFVGNYGGATGTVWGLGASALSHNGQNAVSVSGSGVYKNSSTSRWNNAATYISPNFSGFKVTAQAATKQDASDLDSITSASGTVATISGRDRAPYALGLDYANGPVGAGLTATKNGGEGPKEVYQLGGSYDFGPAAVLAAYQYNRNLDKKNAATVGLKVPLGATTLRLTYNYAQEASLTSENAAFAYAALKNANADRNVAGKMQSIGLGADYKLSKRSTIYAGANYVKAKNDVFSSNTKNKASQVLVGFDHWF